MPGPPVETQPGIALLMRYAARGPDQKRGFAARVSASPHGCLPGWKRWRIQRSPARLRREASELSSPAELRELPLSRAHARTNDLEERKGGGQHRRVPMRPLTYSSSLSAFVGDSPHGSEAPCSSALPLPAARRPRG